MSEPWTLPPCRTGSVVRRIEAQSRSRTSWSDLPVADGLVLDLIAHELRDARGIVHLRPREFQLLATFAANPGRALTREQLVDLAWGVRRPVGLRSIDVHVHWLRSKIEPVPNRPRHLVAVRRFGYRLDPVTR